MVMPLPSARPISCERVREVLNYDPTTGDLTWKVRLSRATKVGAKAGCIERRTGYRIVNVDGRTYSAATIAWAHYYGTWPERYLVFQNRDNTDLRIENLGYKFPEPTPEILEERRRKASSSSREHRRRNPDRYRSVDLRKRFGIGLEEYRGLEAEQRGVCAICQQPETITRNGKPRWLAVDHCHGSGKIRGLLCGRCNPMIGYANDDVAILRAAIAYLERHAAAHSS